MTLFSFRETFRSAWTIDNNDIVFFYPKIYEKKKQAQSFFFATEKPFSEKLLILFKFIRNLIVCEPFLITFVAFQFVFLFSVIIYRK